MTPYQKQVLGHYQRFWAAIPDVISWRKGLLSRPYLDGPDLEKMPQEQVRFLWLIPITKREVDFKNANGLDALEEKFAAAGFHYADPCRLDVV
jgi:hypothetical protein